MKFSAAVVRPDARAGGHFVVVPFDPKVVFGRARAPVKVTVNGHTFATTFAIYGGAAHIGFNADVRAAAGIGPGDVVDLDVVADEDERVVEVPPDLQVILDDDAAAQAAWSALSYSHQKEHVDALDDAKRAETRARRLDACLVILTTTKKKKQK